MNNILQAINDGVIWYANWIWGTPLLILLLGGGIFFVFYSRFIPFRYFFHAINILRGKYDNEDEEGEITHYEALSTALASTVGMGNVSGGGGCPNHGWARSYFLDVGKCHHWYGYQVFYHYAGCFISRKR